MHANLTQSLVLTKKRIFITDSITQSDNTDEEIGTRNQVKEVY